MTELVLESAADAAAAFLHADDQIRAGEVAAALSLAALCELHRVDETMLVPGSERCVSAGGDGTPHIGEFVAGEVAAMLGISVNAAFGRIADVFNVRHRHPTLWAAFLNGEMRWWEATHVSWAAIGADLDAAACERFDRMCAVALRVQPWQRVRPNIAKWIIQADPAKAAERAAAQAADRYAGVNQIEHGATQLYGRLDAADGIVLDEALDHVADQIDGDTHRQRRAAALGVIARSVLGQDTLPTDIDTDTDGRDLCGGEVESGIGMAAGRAGASCATPGPAPAAFTRGHGRRQAELVVRIDAADVADPITGVADIDRWGPVLTAQLTEILAGCHVTVRPVVVDSELPALDRYSIPDAMRLALEVRNPVDVFPYGVKAAWGCDIDHTEPFDHHAPGGAGQTRLSNLGPLSRFTHRLKTLGGWQLKQPEPGIYHWRSPLGYEYLTTAQGTVMTKRPKTRPRRLSWGDPTGDDPPNDSSTR